MTNLKKFSEQSAATSASESSTLNIVTGSANYKITLANLRNSLTRNTGTDPVLGTEAARGTTYVPVNEYEGSGTSWGGGAASGTRTFLLHGHKHRIRQHGTIGKVRVNIVNVADIVDIQFKVFRYDGSAYDEVGASESIADTSLANGWNTLTLSTPITSVQPGDFLAVTFEVDFDTYSEFQGRSGLDTDDWVLLYDNSDVTGNDQTFASSLSGYSLDIEAQMIEPVLVGIGDSFMGGATNSGSTYCQSFIDSLSSGKTWTDIDIGDNIAGYIYASESITYQNLGIGGSTAAQWYTGGSDYVNTYGVDMSCQTAVISLGFNDAMAGTNADTFMAYASDITQTLITASITPIWITVLHDQDGTGTTWYRIRSYNEALLDYCRQYSVACVDAWTLLQDSSTPDKRDGTTYGTGGHPSSNAYEDIADQITGA